MATDRRLHLAALSAIVLVASAVWWLAAASADGETRGFVQSEGAMALTFDDGPDPRYTPQILDTLKAHDARATFFVVGEKAQRHPELVARMVAEGHEVAHHTQTHAQVDRLSQRELEREIDAGLETLEQLGIAPRWYRPPRGKTPPPQGPLVHQRGMRIAMWARALEHSYFATPEQAAATVAAETQPGDIVLAHDGGIDRSMTVSALPLYLDALEARGMTTVTLAELERVSSRRR